MNIEHFLKHSFLKKNKKGHLREIRILPKRQYHEYQSGGERSSNVRLDILCSHCKAPVAQVKPTVLAVGATCTPCRERARVASLPAG